MSSLRQVLNSLPSYFLEDLIQELLGKISVSNRSTQARVLAEALERRETLRMLWERLRPDEQEAVRLALYNGGCLDLSMYEALHGELPEKAFTGLYGYRRKPRYLKLFFLTGWELPDEYLTPLREWVAPPEAHRPQIMPGLPEKITGDQGPAEVRLVETEQAAWHDLAAVLRLAGEGKVRVSDTSRLPTATVVRQLQRELVLLDYYGINDLTRAAETIRPVGLILAIQAAGWAEAEGSLLRLTDAGKAWLDQPDGAGLRRAVQAWNESAMLDEVYRLSHLRGLTNPNLTLTQPESRRNAILSTMREYPAGEWIAIEDFFRTLKLSGHAFQMELDQVTSLQVHGYGLLDNASPHTYWRAVQGPYILAVLMEYLATFGMIDFACVPAAASPYQLAGLKGYAKRPLTRYDGLAALRITPLGDWILRGHGDYVRGTVSGQPLISWDDRGLIQLQGSSALNPNDRAMLERIAREFPDGSFQFQGERVVSAFEQGLKLEEVFAFLRLRGGREVDENTREYFNRLRKRSQVLTQQEEALVFQVKDITLMKTLLQDEILAGLCLLAEDHHLVVGREDLPAFRKRLNQLEAGVRQ